MKYPSYPEYRASGVDWLGEVPAHWPVERLKWSVNGCINGIWGADADGGEDDVICVRVADFDRVALRIDISEPTWRAITRAERASRRLESGDLLLEKSGGGASQPVGAVMQFDHGVEAVTSNFIARMPVAEGFDSRFLTYVHAHLYAGRVNARSIKQTTGIQNLDSQAYLDERVCYPPLDEQRAIAAFLDRETARIDALIATKRRFIALLQEKRAALISRAVTRGLDADVSLKKSSIEWLQMIPAHWHMRRLRYLFHMAGGMTPEKAELRYWDGDIPWVTPKDMKVDVISDSEDRVTTEAVNETGLAVMPARVVLLVVRGMILAHSIPVALTTANVTLNQDMKALLATNELHPDYLAWMLRGIKDLLLTLVEESGHGTKALRTDVLRSLKVPLPPLAEQVRISEELSSLTQKIDELRASTRKAIQVLSEARTALISAAVTGRMDTRVHLDRHPRESGGPVSLSQ